MKFIPGFSSSDGEKGRYMMDSCVIRNRRPILESRDVPVRQEPQFGGKASWRRKPGYQRVLGRAAGELDPTATRIIHLSGNLRKSIVLNEAQRHCLKFVRPKRRRVILNLERVREADSKLVAMLVIILRHARRAGVRLEVITSPHVRDWLTLFRIEWLLPPKPRQPKASTGVSAPPKHDATPGGGDEADS